MSEPRPDRSSRVSLLAAPMNDSNCGETQLGPRARGAPKEHSANPKLWERCFCRSKANCDMVQFRTVHDTYSRLAIHRVSDSRFDADDKGDRPAPHRHRGVGAGPPGFADTVVTASVVILVLAVLICAAALLPILWTVLAENNGGSTDVRRGSGESGRSCPAPVQQPWSVTGPAPQPGDARPPTCSRFRSRSFGLERLERFPVMLTVFGVKEKDGAFGPRHSSNASGDHLAQAGEGERAAFESVSISVPQHDPALGEQLLSESMSGPAGRITTQRPRFHCRSGLRRFALVYGKIPPIS